MEDADCDSGQLCREQRCVMALPDMASCMIDDDCDAGERCLMQRCVPDMMP